MNGKVIEIRNEHGYPVHVKVRFQQEKPGMFQTIAEAAKFIGWTLVIAFVAGCLLTAAVMEIWN